MALSEKSVNSNAMPLHQWLDPSTLKLCVHCALHHPDSTLALIQIISSCLSQGVRMCRVGQNRLYTLYMTIRLVISPVKNTHLHRIYIYICGSGQLYTYTV
jgi:hypothetical protein